MNNSNEGENTRITLDKLDNTNRDAYNIHTWYVSKHAWQRMFERGISYDEVFTILNKQTKVITIVSKKSKNIELLLGIVNEKYITLITNKKTKTVITVRRMRKNEKKIFKESKENK
ncbi:hypothetical protein ACFL56_02100 [Candidatus Margulisiibacteriota bacterium]